MSIANKNILMGVSGGIAAYKTPLLVRELVGRGAQVRVVMTKAARRFVAPDTMAVLARHPVYDDLFKSSHEFPVLHVGLAAWAELVVVAPATANVMAKFSNGLADDLLSTIVLGTRAPLLVAPAMEENMWLHPAVRANVICLQNRGFLFLEPTRGQLASGVVGDGRMAEPGQIAERIETFFARTIDFQGWHLLVTAGPTVEDLDPVRFISNRSSGKMGYAIAERAHQRGAQVVLVSGPTLLAPPSGVDFRPVRTAEEMSQASMSAFDKADAAVLTAAVADFRPRCRATQKIKKEGGQLSVELIETADIAAALGHRKGNRLLVCFAAETENGLVHARAKLKRKKADLVVLNDVKMEGAGFEVDTNIVTLIDGKGDVDKWPLMAKTQVAERLLDRLVTMRGSAE